MKLGLLVMALVAAWYANIGAVVAYAQGFGGPEPTEPVPAPDSKPAPKPRIRWPKAQKLPDQYRARDTDKDGQIGMYEWPRSDYATFRKLDLNRDGFLTPQELTRAPLSAKPAPPAVAAVAPVVEKPAAEAAPTSPAVTDSAPAEAAPTAVPAATTTVPATVPAAAPSNSEAERQWGVLDKDKDGKVTEEEWGKSLFTRPKFRDAGVAVSFPLAREEFLRLYQQVVASSAK